MFQYGAIQEIWKRYFNKFWGNKKRIIMLFLIKKLWKT